MVIFDDLSTWAEKPSQTSGTSHVFRDARHVYPDGSNLQPEQHVPDKHSAPG
jgi:hypothetical protein